MRRAIKLARKFFRDQRGITGLETAIVLIAFVVVSSTFAFAALSTGLFSADQSQATINSGLAQTQGTMEVNGEIIGKEGSANTIDELYINVANAAGGGAVNLDPGTTVIRYRDESQQILYDDSGNYAGEFTVTNLSETDSDYLVESGEIYRISLTDMNGNLTPWLGANTEFTIEIMTGQGASLYMERTTPPADFDSYIVLTN